MSVKSFASRDESETAEMLNSNCAEVKYLKVQSWDFLGKKPLESRKDI